MEHSMCFLRLKISFVGVEDLNGLNRNLLRVLKVAVNKGSDYEIISTVYHKFYVDYHFFCMNITKCLEKGVFLVP